MADKEKSEVAKVILEMFSPETVKKYHEECKENIKKSRDKLIYLAEACFYDDEMNKIACEETKNCIVGGPIEEYMKAYRKLEMNPAYVALREKKSEAMQKLRELSGDKGPSLSGRPLDEIKKDGYRIGAGI